jgi:mannose-1-phosphate guanylyltransferase/mannose-6-phosphate isomerase
LSGFRRHVLVLAGGRGERFWPWSQPDRPKQLLPLASGGRTLLRATLDRALTLADASDILIMTAKDLVPAIQAEAPRGVQVLGEPVGRNTAPAIAAAALRFGAASSFAVMPSDHVIEDLAAFTADLTSAFDLAEKGGVLVTFGIPPTGPETNLGYLKQGAVLGGGFARVAQFCEKPDRARAEAFLGAGGYTWNSGIFVWRSDAFLKALEAEKPEMVAALRGIGPAGDGGDAAFERVFPTLESISVDYAVMEKAPNVVMREASFDWDDLGSWSAWARRQPRDARGNVIVGAGVRALDCDRCVIVSSEPGILAVMGLEDTIVVRSAGGTLVCPLAASDQVRRVTQALREGA